MSTQPIPRRRTEARVLVYNPSHLADDVLVMGHYYHFPPRGVGRCTCAHHSPDRPGGQPGDNQGVHAIYDWPRNEKGHLLMNGTNREVVADAQRVADFIVSEECRGAKGFVILEGDAQQIGDLKGAADRNWVAFYLPQCEQVIANWEASVADYRKTRPGDAAPRQPKVVREAYAFRDDYADALPAAVARRLLFVCNICGDEANDLDTLLGVCNRRHPAQTDYTDLTPDAPRAPSARVLEMARPGGQVRPVPEPRQPPAGPLESDEEMRARLGATEEEIRRDASMGEAAEDFDLDMKPGLEPGLHGEGATPPPRAPGPRTPGGSVVPPGILAAARRKADQEARAAAGHALIAQAKEKAVALSVADAKGLKHGDADVIADVKARVEAATSDREAPKSAKPKAAKADKPAES